MSAGLAAVESPYRGLVPFGDSELDAVLFFGRDREREIIVANLMASRLTLLYGPSGVGKSSLLHAGVAHHLRGLADANITRGEAPQLGVAVFSHWSEEPVAGIVRTALDEVERLTGERPSIALDTPLADALDACASALDGELYVILDQAEEYFTYRDRNGRADRFAPEFAEAVDRRDVRAHFVLSLREDELARLDAFKAAIPGLFGNYLRLDRLDRRAAREAIEGPLREWNRTAAPPVAIEPALVDEVLDEVSVGRLAVRAGTGNGSTPGDGARIEAPYLQLVMQRLWEAERASGSAVLRATTLAGLGGAGHIVGEHLERALVELTPEEKDAAARMFTYLVTPSGSKIAHTPGDLADYAGVDAARAEEVLRSLATQRIVRPVEAAGGDGARYEIFHDVLGETVMAWRSAYVAERRLVQERALARRKQRQLFGIVAATLVALAVVGSVAVYALGKRGEARDQARVAKARELVVSSQSRLESDPELSVLLALEAAKLEPTQAVEHALRQGLIRSEALDLLRFDAPVLAAASGGAGVTAVTADGRLHLVRGGTKRVAPSAALAAFDPTGTRVALAGARSATVLSATTGRVVRRIRTPVDIGHVALDGRIVAVADRTGGVDLVPLGEGRTVRLRVPKAATALAVRGERVAVASGKAVRIFDRRTGRPVTLFRDRKTVTALALSPDGTSLVTSANDGGVRTWDADGHLTNVLVGVTGRGSAVAYTPDGKRVVAGFDDGRGVLRRANDSRDLGAYVGHRGRITTIDISRDGERAVTASLDGTVRTWDAVGDPLLVRRQRLHRLPVALVWHEGRPTPIFDRSADRRIDDRARVERGDVRLGGDIVLRGAGVGLRSFRFRPDGRRAVTTNGTADVSLWDTERGSLLTMLPHQGGVADAAFSPDGRWVITAAPTTVYLWDVSQEAAAELVTILVGHTKAPLVSAIFSPDGKTIASAAHDRTIRTYHCQFCGGLPDLVALARTRLARSGRRLTAVERAEHLGG